MGFWISTLSSFFTQPFIERALGITAEKRPLCLLRTVSSPVTRTPINDRSQEERTDGLPLESEDLMLPACSLVDRRTEKAHLDDLFTRWETIMEALLYRR